MTNPENTEQKKVENPNPADDNTQQDNNVDPVTGFAYGSESYAQFSEHMAVRLDIAEVADRFCHTFADGMQLESETDSPLALIKYAQAEADFKLLCSKIIGYMVSYHEDVVHNALQLSAQIDALSDDDSDITAEEVEQHPAVDMIHSVTGIPKNAIAQKLADALNGTS